MAKVITLPHPPALGQGQKQRLQGIFMRLSLTQAGANRGCGPIPRPRPTHEKAVTTRRGGRPP